jgi:hypothetical protein
MSRFDWCTYERFNDLNELLEGLLIEGRKKFFAWLSARFKLPPLELQSIQDFIDEGEYTEHDVLDAYCEYLEETEFEKDKNRGFIWMNETEHDDAFVILQIDKN